MPLVQFLPDFGFHIFTWNNHILIIMLFYDNHIYIKRRCIRLVTAHQTDEQIKTIICFSNECDKLCFDPYDFIPQLAVWDNKPFLDKTLINEMNAEIIIKSLVSFLNQLTNS